MSSINCNVSLFKQINIHQMFDKIQMILMIMKKSVSNNRIWRLKKLFKHYMHICISSYSQKRNLSESYKNKNSKQESGIQYKHLNQTLQYN